MMRKILIIIFVIFFLNSIFLLAEYISIVEKKDGWDLPNIEKFFLKRDRIDCEDEYKNCYAKSYIPKTKVYITICGFSYKLLKNSIPYIEIDREEYSITILGIYYYKTHPFCYSLINREKEGIRYCHFIDMDLDGKFELKFGYTNPVEYFLKFSPKVDEEDRFKGPAYLGGKEIK